MTLAHSLRALLAATFLLFAAPLAAHSGEDGYDLWLRYGALDAAGQARYRPRATELVAAAETPTLRVAAEELERGLGGLLDRPLARAAAVGRDGAILLGTPATTGDVAGLKLPLDRLGAEGFLIRSMRIDGRDTIVIAAREDVGILYGAFRLLRLIQTGAPHERRDVAEAPSMSPMRRGSSSGCSITGTISIARSSAAMPASRCGTGTSCPTISIRATAITRAPMPRSASTAPC
jgi:alpha-glucuronidase